MKRLIITSCVYSVLSYAVIFLFSLFTVSGEGIFPNMVLSYRVMKSLQLFCIWLPAILITAFLVSYSVLFGKSPKVFNRFSKELKKLFKTVAIVAIVGTGLITLTTELFLPMIEKKITYLEKSPQLYEEYVTLAKKYEEEGYYATAFQYAKAAEYIAMEKDFESFAGEVESALQIKEKLVRLETLGNIHAEAKARIPELFPETTTATSTLESWADEIIENLTARIMRGNILAGKPRIDGRDNKTVRPIEIELGVLPRAHGSALFTRGETQALVSLTLGGGKDALPIESLDGDEERDFILNYNFPGYSVGECKGLKSPGRREIGHGNLAWRALHPMVPSRSEFDYVIRVVSDILESNGSSSMATTCGATLAMMDGGVPLKRPVAGIAMGLIKEGDDYAILTDILGDEDHLGDMDFKVTGTDHGITALQMDIKITSITFEIMEHALAQAKEGRMHILGKIEKAIKAPRKHLSEYAPQAYTMKINPDKVRDVIGKGGTVIQALTRETNTQIDLADDGSIKIMATSKEDADAAIARIKDIVAEPEVGVIYPGVVSGVKDFGLFVKILNGFESMVHISEITGERIAKIEDTKIKEGDKVYVRYLGADKRGKTRMSMVGIDQKTGKEIEK